MRHSKLLAALALSLAALHLTSCSDCGCSPEHKASRGLEAVRSKPAELRAFLVRMPKGADLHNHLSGAVYAESWLRAAQEDGVFIDRPSRSFVGPDKMTPKMKREKAPDGKLRYVLAKDALADQGLFDDMVDSLSMRNFLRSTVRHGHDHFFSSFERFDGTKRSRLGQWVHEAAARAAAQNEQYIELMHTPKPLVSMDAIAKQVGTHEDLSNFDAAPIRPSIDKGVAEARQELDQLEARRRQEGRCGQPDQSPGCKVEVRYIYQVFRDLPKDQVLARTFFGFALAAADQRVVGVNFVRPEDNSVSMSDYRTHMGYVKFFHALYPSVRVALHAGELAYGQVPPEGLCCHIRLAIEEAQAERIGHGVDVMYETDAHELLKKMATDHIMVEINLSSNDLILGVAGDEHPFQTYRKSGVPVALSTDDEGISRIDLTHEYQRAVQTYALTYADLKQMVRTSLEHSFLPGGSIWKERDKFTAPAPACAHDRLGTDQPSTRCSDFLKASERARQQWELERRFSVFEATF